MWNKTKQQQFDELRCREAASALTAEEKHALEQLFCELEQEEWQQLDSALSGLREEQLNVQKELARENTQNTILVALDSRQNDLLKRAQAQLKDLRNEHETLKTERQRVLEKLAA